MNFTDINEDLQNKMLELLGEHLTASSEIIKDDDCLLPMLLISNDNSEKNQIISLQPADGNIDVDKAYNFVLQKLKDIDFSLALFSYSTQIGSATGNISDAIKTCIFIPGGIAVTFYTPYISKRLFKKTIAFEKTILGEIEENVFG